MAEEQRAGKMVVIIMIISVIFLSSCLRWLQGLLQFVSVSVSPEMWLAGGGGGDLDNADQNVP